MHYVVDIDAGHLLRALEAVRHEVITPQAMLASIGESLFRVNQARHDQGLAPDGTRWKELSPFTVAQKGGKGRILRANGDMLDSFHPDVTGVELRLGFSDRKARWHHFGTPARTITPKKAKALAFGGMFRKRVRHPGLPARPLVGFPTSDEQLVADVTADHLELVLKSVR
ncbi:phage tail protein [Burkholderia metallica]|uniref:phage virion morphogenesis protein n=1 Tax=Burkholderia metallica TaxID=488729 RepID=UPI00157AC772|nr:phage virion morphogenesis protein [Burkholderia metallica]NTZ82366.1 phage tail protein [Burkholderia metallica]